MFASWTMEIDKLDLKNQSQRPTLSLAPNGKNYGGHGGSLFRTRIKFDSQIFSSAPPFQAFIYELTKPSPLPLVRFHRKICESNLILVQKSEPPWLP